MIVVTDKSRVGSTGTQSSQSDESRSLGNWLEGVIPANSQAAWPQVRVLEVLEEIDRLRMLEDDWNGEEASSIDANAISLAKRLVGAIAQARGYSWVRPEVAPTPDGGVGLSWDLGHTLAWLIIPPGEASVTCVIRETSPVTTSSVTTRRVLSPDYAIRAVLFALQN